MSENNSEISKKCKCRKRGCEFYSSDRYNGFCSGCARDENLEMVTETRGPRSLESITDSMQKIPATDLNRRPSNSIAGQKRKSVELKVDNKGAGDSSNIAGGLSTSRLHLCEAKVNSYQYQPLNSADEIPNSGKSDISDSGGGKEKAKRRKINRCHICSKKVGLLGFDCRCGGLFCALHRSDQDHDCTFDYKSLQRAELAEKNPKIVADKVTKL